MHEPTSRRFTLLDAMILVGASAVGLAAIRSARVIFQVSPSLWSSPVAGAIHLLLRSLHYGLPMLLGPLAYAAVMIRLRRPRPSWRRLWRQPGWVASVAVTATLLADLLLYLGIAAAGALPAVVAAVMLNDFTRRSSYVVAGAWLVLALSGRWRAEPSWVDRLGRTVAVGWFVVTAAYYVSFFARSRF